MRCSSEIKQAASDRRAASSELLGGGKEGPNSLRGAAWEACGFSDSFSDSDDTANGNADADALGTPSSTSMSTSSGPTSSSYMPCIRFTTVDDYLKQPHVGLLMDPANSNC